MNDSSAFGISFITLRWENHNRIEITKPRKIRKTKSTGASMTNSGRVQVTHLKSRVRMKKAQTEVSRVNRQSKEMTYLWLKNSTSVCFWSASSNLAMSFKQSCLINLRTSINLSLEVRLTLSSRYAQIIGMERLLFQLRSK